MPIPPTTSSDVLLSTLLVKQAENFDDWIDLKDILKSLPNVDRHYGDTSHSLPVAVRNDVVFLEQHSLLEFKPENPHVRLTPIGVYSALMFDLEASPPRP